MVHASPERLSQIIDNLLSNAFEAAPAHSTVTVAVRTGRQRTELRVRDQGPGMTAEEREHAFDRFWRSREGGSGLGLAIVRRLVQIDDGDVELRDVEGGGLEVLVRVPTA